MDIKQITPVDVPGIAVVHIASFPKDHITAHFSEKVLTLFLQKLISYEIYNIVASDSENRVAGYLIAGYNYRKALIHFVKEHYLTVIKILLFSPAFIPDKIKSFFLKKHKADPVPIVNLDIIAVNPLIKNQGIGSKLIEYFEGMLLRDNIREYILYVKENNESAIDFYKKRGFSIFGSNGSTLIMKKEIR
jgi:ribosomal protein S18 acetylase RimI-like enzyme